MENSKIEWTNKVSARFWSKVNKNESCWYWIGSKNQKGYGQIRINKICYMAHRVIFEIAKGPIEKGNLVCHHCDNPSCVNPDHLFQGTAKDNTADMYAKNRQYIPQYTEVGENHCCSKLTNKEVLLIRKSYPGKTMQQLSDEFSLSIGYIHRIIHRKAWKHI